MSSVQQYLKIVHDRSTPPWVVALACRVVDMDVCAAVAGIETIKELLDLKFEEQKLQEQFEREGHDDTWEGEVRYG